MSHIVLMAEFAAQHTAHNDPSEFGKDVWALLQLARQVAGHEYVNAQRLRTIFRREMDEVWAKTDVLITPATPITAPLASKEMVDVAGEEENVRLASTRFVRGWNVLGEPALAMPCGSDSAGLPVGLQLIASPFAEPQLLQTGKTLEFLLS